MTHKRYYPENINPKNTLKSCKHACSPSDYYPGGKCDKMGCYIHKVRKVETRKQFTETEINYIKFKNWWFGFAVGSLVTGLIYFIQTL